MVKRLTTYFGFAQNRSKGVSFIIVVLYDQCLKKSVPTHIWKTYCPAWHCVVRHLLPQMSSLTRSTPLILHQSSLSLNSLTENEAKVKQPHKFTFTSIQSLCYSAFPKQRLEVRHVLKKDALFTLMFLNSLTQCQC